MQIYVVISMLSYCGLEFFDALLDYSSVSVYTTDPRNRWTCTPVLHSQPARLVQARQYNDAIRGEVAKSLDGSVGPSYRHVIGP